MIDINLHSFVYGLFFSFFVYCFHGWHSKRTKIKRGREEREKLRIEQDKFWIEHKLTAIENNVKVIRQCVDVTKEADK